METKIPEVGQKIYVPSSLYMSRGSDDVCGGLAEIEKVELSDHLPPDHHNYIMVGIKNIPRVMYNYRGLREKQETLEEEYGENEAYPDPDDRPEFNDDISGWTRVK